MTASRCWWYGGLLLIVAVAWCGAQEPADETKSDPAQAKAVERERKLAAAFDGGRRWAVIVGVNQYEDRNIPSLQYCVADARLMAKTLQERCGYDEKQILLMVDDQEKVHLRPSKLNLQNQIPLWLKKAAPGDTVLVFFSGHGFLDDRAQGFLAPTNAELASLGLTSLRTDELRDMLHQCQATQKLLVLDCCHAGGDKSVDVKPGPSSVELGAAFAKAQGLVTLASCRKSERSREWRERQQGLFTYFLTQGLAGHADLDGNQLIDSDELYRYTFEEVSTTAQREFGAEQNPARIIRDDVVGVFALARVDGPPPEPMPEPTPAAPESLRAPFTEQEAKAAQAAWAEHLGFASVWANDDKMKFVLIPPGTFEMGNHESPAEHKQFFGATNQEGERPQHTVTITRPFCLSAHEVTFGQFLTFYHDAKYKTTAETDGAGGRGWDTENAENAIQKPEFNFWNTGFEQAYEQPVVNVSLVDAEAYCEWLSTRDGRTYRLPTEAEWEYACRAGTQSRYYFGDDPADIKRYENVYSKWDVDKEAVESSQQFKVLPTNLRDADGFVVTAPVGSYRPNPFGLYDMLGNVCEWCGDYYDENYYENSPTEDPAGPETGDYRVTRGGFWKSVPSGARCARRYATGRLYRDYVTGFRIVFVVAE